MKKILAIMSITIFVFSFSSVVFSKNIKDVINKLSKQDGRFKTILRDLQEVNNGEGGLTRREILTDISQNFAEIAKFSQADPKLLKDGLDYFSRYSEKYALVSRKKVFRLPVRSKEKPGFFEKIWEKMKDLPQIAYEEFMDWDFDADLDIYNINILEGVNISAKYKYAIDSDYSKGIHTRIDKWTPKTNISLRSLVNKLTGKVLPVYLNISGGKEIIFVRHFKDKWPAMKALPKTPLNMPIRVKEVKEMNVGDFCSIPTKMGLNAGISLGWTKGVFSAGASGGVLMTGEFRINIYKTDENHVRLKISGLRSQGVSGGFSTSFGLNFFGQDPLIGQIDIDDQVESLLGTNFFRINRSYIKGQQLTVDYIFDLRDQQACDAFEAIVFKTLKFKATQVGTNFIKENNLDDVVFGDLEPAETLFQADKDLDPSQRRVNRCFMGSNYALSNNRSMKIGIKLANYSSSSSDIRNRVRIIDQNDITTNYIYPIYTRISESSFLFGFWKEKKTRVNYSFYLSDKKWDPQRLYDVVFSINEYDKRCRKGELKDYLKEIRSDFGDDFATELGFINYSDIKFTKNFTSRIQIAFKQEGMYALHNAKLSKDSLYKAFIPVIQGFDYYSNDSDDDDSGFNDGLVNIYSKWSKNKKIAAKLCNEKWGGEYYWHMINKIVKEFDKNRDKPLADYVEMIKRMFAKSNSFFQSNFYEEVMPRYVLELVKMTSSRENVYATIDFGGKDIQRFNAVYGKSDYWQIYHNINEILYQIRYNNYGLPR